MEERMQNYANTTSTIRGCKVSDPHIVVDGENVIAGGLCGEAGNQKNLASIKDSYVSQSVSSTAIISVNADTEEVKSKYSNASVGSFCGLLSAGTITNSYSAMTTTHVTGFVRTVTPGTGNNPPTIGSKQIANGFCNITTGSSASIANAYTEIPNSTTNGVTSFVSGWPSWPLFEGDPTSNGKSKWPALSWNNSWADVGAAPTTYPTLIWEHPLYIENK